MAERNTISYFRSSQYCARNTESAGWTPIRRHRTSSFSYASIAACANHARQAESSSIPCAFMIAMRRSSGNQPERTLPSSGKRTTLIGFGKSSPGMIIRASGWR